MTSAASRNESALHSANVRNEREVPRPLDRVGELALVARARAAQATRQDLAVVGDEASEGAIILVVDEMHARLTEGARLLWPAHRVIPHHRRHPGRGGRSRRQAPLRSARAGRAADVGGGGGGE